MQVFGLTAASFDVTQVVVNRKRLVEALDAEQHRFVCEQAFSPRAEVRAADEVIAGFVSTLVTVSRW
jgi:hypothetical protein